MKIGHIYKACVEIFHADRQLYQTLFELDLNEESNNADDWHRRRKREATKLDTAEDLIHDIIPNTAAGSGE